MTALITDTGWRVEQISLDGQPVLSVKWRGIAVGHYDDATRAGIFTDPADVERVMGRAEFKNLRKESSNV